MPTSDRPPDVALVEVAMLLLLLALPVPSDEDALTYLKRAVCALAEHVGRRADVAQVVERDVVALFLVFRCPWPGLGDQEEHGGLVAGVAHDRARVVAELRELVEGILAFDVLEPPADQGMCSRPSVMTFQTVALTIVVASSQMKAPTGRRGLR